MGKSRAEIQKAYRERLKQRDNEGYLEKERKRRRESYIPSEQLTHRDRNKRNELNRIRLRRYYEKKRNERQEPSTSQTSGYESCEAEDIQSISTEETEPKTPENPRTNKPNIRIKYLPFNNRSNGPKKRWRRNLADAKNRIRQLEDEKEKALKKFKAAQRNLQRLKKRIKPNNKTTNINDTPRKRTEDTLDNANLTIQQKEKLRKPLLLGNVLIDEIKETNSKTQRSKKTAIYNMVSGKIVKKYRCVANMSRKTGLCRHKLSNAKSKMHQIGTKVRMSKRCKIQENVIQFLEREDNSRTQPGKKDAIKTVSGKRQSYVLTDYLSNLYVKFKSENPSANISFTTFTRTRPKYILTASFISRHTCLCTKHQNAALTAKALRRYGIEVPLNPEHMLKETNLKEKVREQMNDDTDIKFSQWKRVEIEEKGKKKYVTKIVEFVLGKQEFVPRFENQIDEFTSHVNRVNTQYNQIRTLKEKLPPHNMIIQMDFAENYSCRSVEEVQSAYFNQTAVTLHPMVVYYKNEGGLTHESFIVISDELSHKSSTVLAFIEELMPSLKLIDPDLDTIHYWTDSPTSQYRNKHVFEFVANHKDTYGTNARWNYFESGHGKGPCDGLGGTCKRLADEASRSGRHVIQNAKDFYDWAVNSSMKNVKFRFVAAHRCEEAAEQLLQKELKAIKGTMKVHSIVGLGNSKIKTRDVSCYCDMCLTGNTCNDWKTESMKLKEKENNEVAENPEPHEDMVTDRETIEEQEISKEDEPEYKEGDFVAALYDGNWFIGKIIDVDRSDLEYEITFMEKKKDLYKWPSKIDKLWIAHSDMLRKIKTPVATGKSKRMFAIDNADLLAIRDVIKN